MINKLLTYTLLLLSIIIVQISLAQDFSSHLPENTFFYLSIDGENLQEKMSIEAFQNLDFYKEISQELMRDGLSGNIAEAGVDLNGEFTVFATLNGDYAHFGMAIPVSDSDNIQKLLNLHNTNLTLKNDVLSKTTYSEFTGVNSNYLIWVSTEYMGTSPPLWGADEQAYEEYDQKRELRSVKGEEFGLSLFNESTQSLGQSKNFKKSFNAKADANLFFTVNSALTNKYLTAEGMIGLLTNGNTAKQNFLNGDQYSNTQLFFEKNDVNIISSFFPNEKNLNLIKAISKSKPNKDFLKYTPSEKLLGVYSLNINSEEVLNELPNYIAPLLDSFLPMTNGGEKSTSLISTLIDEEALGHLINGDILVTVSNWGPKPTTKVSYEYDEDFNYSETVTESTEDLPDLLFMAGSEDIEGLNNMLEFLALDSPLAWNESYYLLPHNRDLPMDMYIFTTEEGFFMTNNKTQMNQIKSGTSIGEIPTSVAKNTLTKTQHLFVDFKEITSIMKDLPGMSKEDEQIFTMLSNNLGSLSSSQLKPSGKSSSTVTVMKFKDGVTENSLSTIFNIINQGYLIFISN